MSKLHSAWLEGHFRRNWKKMENRNFFGHWAKKVADFVRKISRHRCQNYIQISVFLGCYTLGCSITSPEKLAVECNKMCEQYIEQLAKLALEKGSKCRNEVTTFEDFKLRRVVNGSNGIKQRKLLENLLLKKLITLSLFFPIRAGKSFSRVLFGMK